jgi:anti-sigma factor RsiW
MSDKPSNYELDDELLSAYLDGELSADERAAVEARLATDPAAPQLLHELRSVSQSVQALPTESLGRDLSEEILRRARQAKPELVVRGSPDPAQASDRRSPGISERETFDPSAGEVGRPAPSQSPSADAMPKIKIFGSRRAWFWASLALAAGLLIMIVQSGDEPNKKLPPVASRNGRVVQNQPTDESGQPARREISISATPKAASPPPSAVASDHEVHEKLSTSGGEMPAGAPTPGFAGGGQFGSNARDGGATRSPVAAAPPKLKALKEEEKTNLEARDDSSASTAQPSQVAVDKLAVPRQPTGGVRRSGEALGLADAKEKSSPTGNDQPFFVVRVVAKPDALRHGSFDRLLAANKIELEPQPAQRQSLSLGGGGIKKLAENDSIAKQLSKKVDDHAADMVLVEAPPAKIESCLADLNKNSNDFLSVDVNGEPQSRDRSNALSTPSKKLGEDPTNLSRFNRGAAPVAQKDTVDLRSYFYSYEFDKPNELAISGSGGPGGFKSAAEAPPIVQRETNGADTWANKKQPNPDVSRARRIQITSLANPQPGESASAGGRAARIQSGAETMNQPMSQRKLEQQAESKLNNDRNNNWKVLFVFTPEDASASSPPSNNRAK